MTGIEMIAAERERQLKEERWTLEHDATHTNWELSAAGACYATPGNGGPYSHPLPDRPPRNWPVDWDWKPSTDPVRNLVRAGALIAAEIDRLTQSQEP